MPMSLTVARKKTQSGSSLVESLLSVGILMIALVGPLALVQRGLSTSAENITETIALYLAQDALEFIKNINDTNRVEGKGWLTDLDPPCLDASCTVDTTVSQPLSSAIVSCGGNCGVLRYDSSTNQYGYDLSWADSIFTRSFSITEVVADEEARVTATVSWESGASTNYVTLSGYLFYPQYDIAGSGWDLDTAVYNSINKRVNPENNDSKDIAFSTDGLNMYVLGGQGDEVNRYTLAVPWSLSNVTHVSPGGVFSVGAQDTSPRGLFFKADGTKMYYLGNQNERVYQYTLSTPWDISAGSISYDNLSKDVSAELVSAGGLYMSPDGTKMYIIDKGTSDHVEEYTLSSAWVITSATHETSFPLSGQTATPSDVFFRPDGERMFVVANGGSDKVYQYTLTTPWTISTALYDSISYSVQGDATTGIYFNSNGTKMYTLDDGSIAVDTVYQYSLDVSY
jgi:hypothetical protein